MFSENEFQKLNGKDWVMDCPPGLSLEADLIWGLSNELGSYVEMTCEPEELRISDPECHAQLGRAEEYLVKHGIPRPEPVARVLARSLIASQDEPPAK